MKKLVDVCEVKKCVCMSIGVVGKDWSRVKIQVG